MAFNSIFLNFLFPPPSSLFINTMSVICCISLANIGYKETKGNHIQYSKFMNVGISKKPREKQKKKKLCSRNGMLISYTPAFLLGLASFAVFSNQDRRFMLLTSALTVHFFKRVLEVLFVHKYTNFMALETVIIITFSYIFYIAIILYAQYLSMESTEPSVDLKNVGIALFLIGTIGNFYHHYLLANLRRKDDKEYKIPRGGLFNLVVCPHYLFEILMFMGISCISQTTFSFAFTLGIIFNLTGRSYATRQWYIVKFDDKFPKDVKAFIPYVF